jgi:predicted MFS family arabinose efflux permease
MPPSGTARLRTLIDVLRRPTVGLGMFATTLVFTGHFAFFTYLRPFLEQVAGVGVNGLSAILLGYGSRTSSARRSPAACLNTGCGQC